MTFEENETVSIQLHANDGEVIILKESLDLQKGGTGRYFHECN